MSDYSAPLARVWTYYLRSLTGQYITLSPLNVRTMMGLHQRVSAAPDDYQSGEPVFVEPFPAGGAPEYPSFNSRPCSEE